jgi:hypothetical protein
MLQSPVESELPSAAANAKDSEQPGSGKKRTLSDVEGDSLQQLQARPRLNSNRGFIYV